MPLIVLITLGRDCSTCLVNIPYSRDNLSVPSTEFSLTAIWCPFLQQVSCISDQATRTFWAMYCYIQQNNPAKCLHTIVNVHRSINFTFALYFFQEFLSTFDLFIHQGTWRVYTEYSSCKLTLLVCLKELLHFR